LHIVCAKLHPFKYRPAVYRKPWHKDFKKISALVFVLTKVTYNGDVVYAQFTDHTAPNYGGWW